MAIQIKKIYNVFVLFFFLWIFNYSSLSIAGDQYEPDNSQSVSTLLEAGVVQEHSIDPADDVDWFRFTLTKTEYVEIESTGIEKTRMLLYDENLLLLQNAWYPARIKRRLDAGLYYLRVQNGSGPKEIIESYYISLTTTSSSGDSFEPDNIPDDASLISAGSTQTHSISPGNDEDWLVFTLEKTEYVELKTTGLSKTRIYLYDEYLLQIAVSSGFQDGLIRKKIDPGKYYIRVINFATTLEIDRYYFSLLTTGSHGDKFETDNIPADATVVINNSPNEHSIYPAGDKDWIMFTLEQDDNVELKTSSESDTVNTLIKVYDAHLSLVKSSTFWDSSMQIALKKGTYYASIAGLQSYSQVDKYSLAVAAHYFQVPINNHKATISPVLHLLLAH